MDHSVEIKLVSLFKLQHIESEIDRLRTYRGELPMEVRDLEDEVAGMETRLERQHEELAQIKRLIAEKEAGLKEAEAHKGIEIQSLEIQIAEKKIKELSAQKEMRSTEILTLTEQLGERRTDLDKKRAELDGIVAETEEEEKQLLKEAEKASKKIEARLLGAYQRIRGNARNGLAVVSVQRDACGGCFNHIPPQLQMDIRLRKKITVCEHCGRILVDTDMEALVAN